MTRILVAEDSRTQAEELRLILEAEGFTVEIAPDGQQALGRVGRFRCDLIVSDIVMPGMTGYELCRRIKADPATKYIPVLLVTTLSDPMDIIQGLECGADNYVTKPYDPAGLVARINGILENRRLRAEGRLTGGVEILFLGRTFTITSDREQILDLLISTFEDIVRTNRELQAREAELAVAKSRVEEYAQKLEAKVRLSEEKYRGLMENARDAILIVDEEGRVLESNREAEVLLGRARGDIISRPYQQFAVPAEREYTKAQFETLLSEQSARTDNVHFQRPDGTLVCVDLSGALVETNGKSVAVVIARDVTERNRLQQQAFRQDKLSTMGTLAAGVAHEINNPAAVVLGNLGLLRSDLDTVRRVLADVRAVASQASGRLRHDLDEITARFDPDRWGADVEEMTGDCLHAAERIRDIVGDLRNFAHVGDETIEPVNVNEVVDTALRMALAQIRRRAVVDTDYSEDLPQLQGSRGRLEQLFLNLLINAAQALDTGGPGENRIRVATRLESGRIRVDVADTGVGIPEELVPKVFESFFTTKAVGEGTGLGLSICHDIVRKHGGEIQVASKVGEGTTFTVYLPPTEAR